MVTERMAYEDIQAALKERGHKQADLANLLAINPTGVSKAFNGKRRFTAEEVDKIRQWLGMATATPGRPVGSIPVLSSVAAGNWKEAVATSTGSMPKPDPSIPDHAIALDVDGDSMNLFVPDGGRIIYDPQDRALYPRRFYVVRTESGEATFKRFFADPARLEPCSDNPDHKPIILGGDETFTIIGRVIWHASRMPE